jgi:hypothetical protein
VLSRAGLWSVQLPRFASCQGVLDYVRTTAARDCSPAILAPARPLDRSEDQEFSSHSYLDPRPLGRHEMSLEIGCASSQTSGFGVRFRRRRKAVELPQVRIPVGQPTTPEPPQVFPSQRVAWFDSGCSLRAPVGAAARSRRQPPRLQQLGPEPREFESQTGLARHKSSPSGSVPAGPSDESSGSARSVLLSYEII